MSVYYMSTTFHIILLSIIKNRQCFCFQIERISAIKMLYSSENIRKIENEYCVHCLVSWCSSMFKLLSVKCQCLKLNTYLVTIVFSEQGSCVYIEIPQRISPAPTFKALKNMSAVMLHFLKHVFEYRMTCPIYTLNTKL